MNKIKFNNGIRLPLYDISSTSTQLTFSVLDDARNGLETICKDADRTSVIQLIDVNEETQDETVLKGYAGYTNLVSMKTEYGVVTNTDYETTDSTTESGFAEEKHDITTVVLRKPTQAETVASEIDALKESQALQEGAIEELASVVSDISEGQALQDGAIEELAEVVSEITEE